MRRPLLVAIGMAWAATACTGTSDGAPVHETVPEGPPVDVPVEVTDEAPVPEAMLLGAGGVSQDEYLGDGGAVAIASAADGRITARWSDDQGKTGTGTTLPGDDYEDDGTLLLQQAGDHVLVLAQGEETTEERLSSPLIADDSGERVRPDTPNVVIRSDDGGRTWERSSLPIAGRLNTDSSLQVVGEGDLLAIVGEFGADPTLGWVSEDGGQTWRVLETSEDDERPDTIFHAAVRDGELRLWAVNGRDHPLLLRSDDAGPPGAATRSMTSRPAMSPSARPSTACGGRSTTANAAVSVARRSSVARSMMATTGRPSTSARSAALPVSMIRTSA